MRKGSGCYPEEWKILNMRWGIAGLERHSGSKGGLVGAPGAGKVKGIGLAWRSGVGRRGRAWQHLRGRGGSGTPEPQTTLGTRIPAARVPRWRAPCSER